jgi:hypothetical protein
VTFLSPQVAKELEDRDRTDALAPPRRVAIGRPVVERLVSKSVVPETSI